jgi:hypothetical protein
MRSHEIKEADMTLAIELPPEMEERLNREAARRGIEPARLVLVAMESLLPEPAISAQEPEGNTPGMEELLSRPSRLKVIQAHLNRRREAGLPERPFYETASAEEWIAAMQEWVESHPETPPLPPGWDSRESMYEERTLNLLGFRRDE